MFDIKKAFAVLTENLEDPLAAVKIQNAYAHANELGRLLASVTMPEEVEAAQKFLIGTRSDEEMDSISVEPAFVMALAAMLCESLIAMVNKAVEEG
jgi:hypothetical protein